MLRVLFGVLVCFASLCVAPATQAGILTNGMTNLEDNDWESQVSGLGDGTLDVGDLLLSVIEIQASEEVLGTENGAFDGSLAAGVRTTYTKTTRAITGISVIRVASVVLTSPFSARFTFVGASAAEWLTHSGLVVADGVGAILYDDPASGLANHVDFTTVASGIATATEGSLIAYFTPVGWRADTISFGGTPTSVLAID